MRRYRIGSFLAVMGVSFFVAVFLLGTLGMIAEAVLHDSGAWGGAVVMGLLSIGGGLVAWRTAYASTDGSRLYLTTVRGSDEVPLSSITKVVAHSKGWRYLELELDPPARLGRVFWIFAPQDFSGAALWDAYEFLSEFAKEASHDRPGSVAPRVASRRQSYVILGVWAAVILAIVLLFQLA